MSEKAMQQDNSELVEWTNGRRIYPEVAQYLREAKARERAYEEAIADAEYAFNKAYRQAQWAAEDAGRIFDTYGPDRQTMQDLRRQRQEAYDAAQRARDTSGRDLLLNSPHPEVKWIAEHCLFANQGSEVEGYAKDILAILPATTEQIWEEAKDNRGMCEVFDRFYDQAEAAGIFSNGTPHPAAKEIAAFRNYVRRNYGSSYVRDMQRPLDRIIKALQEDYERRITEAKAEWQRMDEAYRSNGARKAAETRRANREAAQAEAPKVSLVHPNRPTGVTIPAARQEATDTRGVPYLIRTA